MRPRKRDRHLPPCVFYRHGAYYLVKRGKWTRLGNALPASLEAYGRSAEPSQGSMADLIDQALNANRAKLAANTWRAYQVIAKQLAAIMAEFRPEDVLPRHIAQIRQSLSPSMANRAISVLRVTFAYALDQQLLDVNPTLGVKRAPEHKRERLITPDEYAAIYAKATPQIRVIMDLCYLTGQRIGDILSIRHADLLDEGIQFRQQKTKARLLVRWSPELRAAVETAKALHGNLRALTLLHRRAGQPPSYRYTKELWDAACAAAGVSDAHIHDLRAMAGTAAEAQGIDAQKLLGHTSPANTKRYLRSKEVKRVDGPSFGQVVQLDKTPAKKSGA